MGPLSYMWSVDRNVAMRHIPVCILINSFIFACVYNYFISIHTVSERDCTLFFIFFSRCPVCGEWCKLHWLLLDTPSFDWNTRHSRGQKMFKMAPTKQQKAFCAVEYAKTTSVITFQCNFRRQFEVDPPDKNSIKRWHTQLMETGCLHKGKSTGRCLCVAYAKAKAPDVVFALPMQRQKHRTLSCVFHSTKCLLLFGGRHLEHFVPTGTAGISIKTRSI